MKHGYEICQRCGRPVPASRRGTGFCTLRCTDAQLRADEESRRQERELERDARSDS